MENKFNVGQEVLITKDSNFRLGKIKKVINKGTHFDYEVLDGVLLRTISENWLGKIDKYAKGDRVSDLSYPAIYEILKDKIEEVADDTPYENDYDHTGAEVEHKSYSGFIPFTDGGYEVTWFEYVDHLTGSGKRLPTKPLQEELERQENYNYKLAKENFILKYPEIVQELGEDNIDYNTLYENDYGSEAEELSETERANAGEDSVMMRITAYYYTPENDRGKDGKHTIALQSDVNLESPYHRPGNMDDGTEVVFTFDSIEELKNKMDSGLKTILDWFSGSDYNTSKAEMKIRRMAHGGSIKNQYKGKKDSEIWSEWTIKQRTHFLNDHEDHINELYAQDHTNTTLNVPEWATTIYSDLPKAIKDALMYHKANGQYAKGGKINYPTERLHVNDQSIEERELELFIDNDADLYRQRVTPIRTNLVTKIARGTFDINKAPLIYKYLIDDGIKKYNKELGGMALTKQEKDNLAKEYVNRFLDEAQYGNYENYLPKKYRVFKNGGAIKGNYKLTLKLYDADVYENNYNEGEGNHVNHFGETVNKQFNDSKELLYYINNRIIYKDINTTEFSVIDNRLVTSILVDDDNNPVSDNQIERWKQDNLKLYSANYNFYITLVDEKTPTEEELSELTGISAYKKGGKIRKYNKGGGIGINFRSLMDGELSTVNKKDLEYYNERNEFIDKIETRLGENDWISLSDGTTFEKTFVPDSKMAKGGGIGENTVYYISKDKNTGGPDDTILKSPVFNKDEIEKVFNEEAKKLNIGESLEYGKYDDYQFYPNMLLVEMTKTGLVSYTPSGRKRAYVPKSKHGGGIKNNEIRYKGITITKLHPSGMYEFYSYAQGRFIKSDDLDYIKQEIDNDEIKYNEIRKPSNNTWALFGEEGAGKIGLTKAEAEKMLELYNRISPGLLWFIQDTTNMYAKGNKIPEKQISLSVAKEMIKNLTWDDSVSVNKFRGYYPQNVFGHISPNKFYATYSTKNEITLITREGIFIIHATEKDYDDLIRDKYVKGGSITMDKLNSLIYDINQSGGGEFSLSGAYGQQELWAKDINGGSHRIESGSKKDIYQALIKNRYNKKYNPNYANDKNARGSRINSKEKYIVFYISEKTGAITEKVFYDKEEAETFSKSVKGSVSKIKFGAGGKLVGASHAEGGIKIIAPNGQIEAEGGEIIINKEAAENNCELLSEINQSAGEGVAIPCYKHGGREDSEMMQRISELISEAYTEDEFVDKFIYFTSDKRNNPITEEDLRLAYQNELTADLIEKYDPILFNTEFRNQYATGGSIGKRLGTAYKKAKDATKKAYEYSKPHVQSAYEKSKDFTKTTYDKSKKAVKDKIHDKKKDIAIDVLQSTRGMADDKRDSVLLNEATNLVEEIYSEGGKIRNKKCPVGTEIQSVVFDKKKNKLFAAKDWLELYNFPNATEVDKKKTTYRFRQQEPDNFRKGSLRTIGLESGIRAVIGCPKTSNKVSKIKLKK